MTMKAMSVVFSTNALLLIVSIALFFERGDSGSGVFSMESRVPTTPLGIAFAKHLISQKPAVCRIDEIVNAFNLCLYQYEESMETS